MANTIVTNTAAQLSGKTLLTAEGFPTAGLSNKAYTSAWASPPASPQAGDLWMPTNSIYVLRYSGSAWVPFGPVFPFADPTLQSFSWVNQGGATVSTANGGMYLDVPASASENIRLQVKTSPTAPYTITAAFLLDLRALNYNAVGLVFRESSSGKLHPFFVEANDATSTGVGLASYKYTDATTYSASYVASSAFPLVCSTVIWLRIADNNTNRICSVSRDGVHFRTVHTVGRTDFLTANQVGWGGNADNATDGPKVTLLSWAEA